MSAVTLETDIRGSHGRWDTYRVRDTTGGMRPLSANALRSSEFPCFYTDNNLRTSRGCVQYRRVPRTTLSLSEIGFGCGGNAGLMVRGGHDEQHRAVARALELGINYFDTAPDYGNGAAEDNLGRVLRALGQRPVINSKVEIRQDNLGDIAGHVVSS